MRATEFITEESKSAKYNGLIMKYAFNSVALVLKAFDPTTKNPLAYVKFVKENKELYPQDLWVNDEHRNRGIAKSMYDYLKSEGYVINRSHDQTKAGAGFWDKHRGEDEYVWEDEKLDESKIIDYEGIKLNVSVDGANVDIRALRPDGQQMGYVIFDRDGNTLVPDDLAVDDKYQGQGIAKIMYDYVKSLGFRIEASYDQTEAGKGFWKKHRGEERVWEEAGNTTTLNNLYNGNYPDRDETFWDYVSSSELNTPLTIHTLQKHKVMIMLLSQYRAEHIDDIMDMLDDDRKELVQSYVDDPALSSKVIVLSGDRIIDGNHRALAAAIKGVPINYIDLADLDNSDEEKLDELFQPGKDWKWSFQGSEEAVAVFHVGELPYVFHAYGTDGVWEVEFKRHGSKLDRSQKFGLTGTGNSAEVMSTVVDIMRAFLDKYKDKIEVLRFSAKEGSRQGLYARMVKRLLPDWVMKQEGEEFILVAPTKIEEEVLDEMPLPVDWDPQQYGPGTTFKARLAYALERAKKLGTGSSRVATTIEYQGRPTVLKIAKNQKGLAQNSVEASILEDGYASQMGILIPLIDYDEQNREPTWIHTEMAQKANEKQLCHLMKCQSLSDLTRAAEAQLNEYGTHSQAILNDIIEKNEFFGASEQDADTFLEYVNKLSELKSSFDIELGDFNRAANWGLYQGRPIIIDVGFNSNVLNQYYR